MKTFENYELKKHTTFKIGGKAKKVYFPESCDEFIRLVSESDDIIVLGGGSNVLISDKGVDEDIIITTEMKNYGIAGTSLSADCGIRVPLLARMAQKEGLSGIEFMVGFPGTVGGAVCMNASARGQSVSDTCTGAMVFDTDENEVIDLSFEDLNFSYRNSVLNEKNYILLRAKFDLDKKDPEQINEKMQSNIHFRKAKQPDLSKPNAGSIFKNPPNDSAGRLLEEAGAKGMKEGGAVVWEGHANFILNESNATSKDVSLLMIKMYNMVKEKFKIVLEPEVRYLGGLDKEEAEIWDTMLNKK